MPTPMSSYYVGYLIKTNGDLRMRVSASAQQQATLADPPVDIGNPEAWAEAHAWEYAMAPGWVDAVSSALAGGITDWGKDPGVITDQQILSWVQPRVTEAP